MYNLKHHRNSGDPPTYKNNEQFTAELHIFGDLLEFGDELRIYKGGSVIWVDKIKWETTSVLDFTDAGLDLFGYGGKIRLWYRVPGTEEDGGIERGLRRFQTDADYNEFIRLLPPNRVGVVFYDGVISDLNKARNASQNKLLEEVIAVDARARSLEVAPPVYEVTPLAVAPPYYPAQENNAAEENNGHVDGEKDGDAAEDNNEEDDVFHDSDYSLDEDDINFEDDLRMYKENVTGLGKGKRPIAEELVDDPLSSDYDTDELLSLDSESSHSEDDTDGCQKKKRKKMTRFHQFRKETDLRGAKFTLGMMFANSNEFKEAVKEAFINSGRSCKFDINQWYKVRGVCTKFPKCKYMIYASVIGKPDRSQRTFQVKTMCLTHTCGRVDKIKQVNSTWLAARFESEFKLNPSMKISNFKEIVREKYMCEISDGQAFRAKRLAKQKLEGNHDDQYAKLRDYLQEIITSNPGTTVKLQAPIEGTKHIFKRLYICYDALKKGFLAGCRPIVGLYGCHIKGPHTGQLLSAVGIDGNNAAILEARSKPIIGMLERLRWYLMLRMTKQREASNRWYGDIGPRINNILESNKRYGSLCIPSLAGLGLYQVRTPEDLLYVVDLIRKECSCRRFELCGIPCGHAIACIFQKEEDPVDYVCDWYKKPAWARTYAPFLRPIKDQQEWVCTGLPTVLPPVYKKQRGRPKTVRSREPGETQEAVASAAAKLANDPKLRRSHYVRMTCSVCNQKGHNRATCKRRSQQSNQQTSQQTSQQTTQSAPQSDGT